jgi:hypothetical protein
VSEHSRKTFLARSQWSAGHRDEIVAASLVGLVAVLLGYASGVGLDGAAGSAAAAAGPAPLEALRPTAANPAPVVVQASSTSAASQGADSGAPATHGGPAAATTPQPGTTAPPGPTVSRLPGPTFFPSDPMSGPMPTSAPTSSPQPAEPPSTSTSGGPSTIPPAPMPSPAQPSTAASTGQLPVVGSLACLLSATGLGGTTGLFTGPTAIVGGVLAPLLGACPATSAPPVTGGS